MLHKEGPQESFSTDEILNRKSEIIVRLQNLEFFPGFDHDGMMAAVDKLRESLEKARSDAEFERIEQLLSEAEENDGALIL
jgi:hypothetical protein